MAAVGGLYFGSWGLMMFPYYAGRSSSSGQLQFFLLPASIAAVWLLIGAVAALPARRLTPRLAGAVLLCCLPTALFVSTVIKAPSPELNLKRLAGGFGVAAQFRSANFKPRPVVDEERAQVIRDVSADARKPVGVFFPSGNIASLRTGLPNASVLAAPEELNTQRSGDDPGTVAFRRMQCRSLETSQLNSVIADKVVAARTGQLCRLFPGKGGPRPGCVHPRRWLRRRGATPTTLSGLGLGTTANTRRLVGND